MAAVPDITIAADLGGSGLRLRLLADGAVLDESAQPVTGVAADPVRYIAERVRGYASGRGTLIRVAAGVSGLFGVAPRDRTALPALFGAESVVIADDAVTAHLGAFGGAPGVICAVGTGVVVFGWDGGRRAERVDGWGRIGGDQGGAYWLGMQGAQAALRDIDGRGAAPRLRAAFLERYGSAHAFSMATALAVPAKAYVADFARDVLAAASAGDPVSIAIRDEGARHLADAVRAASERVGFRTTDVALTGRVTRDTQYMGLLASHVERAGLSVAWREARGGPLDGAVVLSDRAVAERFQDLEFVSDSALEGEGETT